MKIEGMFMYIIAKDKLNPSAVYEVENLKEHVYEKLKTHIDDCSKLQNIRETEKGPISVIIYEGSKELECGYICNISDDLKYCDIIIYDYLVYDRSNIAGYFANRAIIMNLFVKAFVGRSIVSPQRLY